MPQFSTRSKQNLGTCHPDLIILFGYVIKYYDCTVIEGYRTQAKQHEYFICKPPRSKVDYPTVHNSKPSNAVDVAPYLYDHISWKKEQTAHFAGFVMAVATMLLERKIITHKIRNGADWDSDNNVEETTFWDGCHFEIIPNPGDIIKYYPE
jgi:peptidoglycan L-alanyl-D-glutamate endopeptidase CwlK